MLIDFQLSAPRLMWQPSQSLEIFYFILLYFLKKACFRCGQRDPSRLVFDSNSSPSDLGTANTSTATNLPFKTLGPHLTSSYFVLLIPKWVVGLPRARYAWHYFSNINQLSGPMWAPMVMQKRAVEGEGGPCHTQVKTLFQNNSFLWPNSSIMLRTRRKKHTFYWPQKLIN